jgi:hypothetical protein
MMFVPLKCSQCGSQNNHVKNENPDNSICVSTTICDDCGHSKVTDVWRTTVTPSRDYQYVKQMQQEVRTF